MKAKRIELWRVAIDRESKDRSECCSRPLFIGLSHHSFSSRLLTSDQPLLLPVASSLHRACLASHNWLFRPLVLHDSHFAFVNCIQ